MCANDIQALACRNIARKRSVCVPHDLSIAGFDNSTNALTAGITSYDFNLEQLMREVICWLLGNHSRMRARSADVVTTTPGYVISRRSTRRRLTMLAANERW